MPDLYKNLQKKMKTFFSVTGLVTDVFPGISIAFWFVYAVVFHFREPLLAALDLQNVASAILHPLLITATVLGSITLWVISGWVWDPVYDHLYPAGAELQELRKSVREKLYDKTKDERYKNPKILIYDPVMTALLSGKPELSKRVANELEVSKAFRNALLPVLFLGGWSLCSGAFVSAFVFLILLLVFVAISFKYRALHSVRAYRWYVDEA